MHAARFAKRGLEERYAADEERDVFVAVYVECVVQPGKSLLPAGAGSGMLSLSFYPTAGRALPIPYTRQISLHSLILMDQTLEGALVPASDDTQIANEIGELDVERTCLGACTARYTAPQQAVAADIL
jgi:hypothetical protein